MKFINKLLFASILLIGLYSCSLDEVQDPNNPTRESLINGATDTDLQFLVSGLESILRSDMEYHYWTTSSVGREYYDLRGTDPRYTGELLGKNGSDLDNNGFLTTRSFSQVYRVVRQANDLLTSVNNSNTSFSDGELNSIKAIANGYKAYSLSLELNRQYENGLRFDVADSDNLGSFLSYENSLGEIRSLIDTAITQLAGTNTFPVNLQNNGVQSVANFKKFLSSLGARIAMYQNDKVAMKSYLNSSYLNLNGDFNTGAYHVFGTGNDTANPLFYGSTNYLAHPTFASEAEAGDTRVNSKTTSIATVSLDDLSANRRVKLYSSNVQDVPMIRNEELILMYAEAHIGNNNGEARRALNIIRNAASLSNIYWTSDADLTNELLKQRRYSLFGEGHRWVDMRRFGRLGQLPLDRSGDKVHVQFPRPQSEG